MLQRKNSKSGNMLIAFHLIYESVICVGLSLLELKNKEQKTSHQLLSHPTGISALKGTVAQDSNGLKVVPTLYLQYVLIDLGCDPPPSSCF